MADKDYETRLVNLGRNEPCTCGSGKKYKKCHLAADEEARRQAAAKTAAAATEAAKSESPAKEKEEHASNPEAKSHKKSVPTSSASHGRAVPVARPINTPRKAS